MTELPPPPPTSRPLHFAVFVTGGLWLLAAFALSGSAAAGFAARYQLALCEPLMEQAALVFLLLVGFTLIGNAITRAGSLRSVNALPQRPTSTQEWTRGLAIGWALALATAVPMMLAGSLHPALSFAPRLWLFTALSLLTLALTTLAMELAFRGFLFQALIAAAGPTGATILLAIVYALMAATRPGSNATSVTVAFAAAVLFAIARLRTGALWLGWGLHFAWEAATALLLGLPLAGNADVSTFVTTTTTGHRGLTGGAYGPTAAPLTLLFTLAALAVVYRASRDYAWNYTHAPIVAAGEAVTIAPPAAHTAMEQASAAPAPLVQILGTTSTDASTLPVIREHLGQADTSGE